MYLYRYYDFPECKPCDCNVNGTSGDVCLPETGQCPCKSNYAGTFCETCAPGYHNFPTCGECTCSEEGSVNNVCNETSGQCPCKPNFAGANCDSCAAGYYNFPACSVCDCDPAGTEAEICDKTDGKCFCKEGFAGGRCDRKFLVLDNFILFIWTLVNLRDHIIKFLNSSSEAKKLNCFDISKRSLHYFILWDSVIICDQSIHDNTCNGITFTPLLDVPLAFK